MKKVRFTHCISLSLAIASSMLIETIASIAIGSIIMTAALKNFTQLRRGLQGTCQFTRVFMTSCDQLGCIAGKYPEQCTKVPQVILGSIGHADKYYVYRQVHLSDSELEALLRKSKDAGMKVVVTTNDEEIYIPTIRNEIDAQILAKDIWIGSS